MDDPPVPRLLQRALQASMADTPVVCLLGPRQCGKSTLVEHQVPGRAYFSLDENNYLTAARADPAGFIAQLPDEVTIDEVQRVPELFLAIKRRVDTRRRPGSFLLTGSANLLQMPRLADSLAGRMECIYLHPFAAAEVEGSAGKFLAHWLDGKLKPELKESTRPMPSTLPERLLAGGYPESRQRKADRARQWHRQYLASIIQRDVQDVSQVKDGRDVQRLLEFLAHRTAELLNISAVAGALQLDRATVERHLVILEKLFLIRRLPAWSRNAANRLIKTPKVHVCDSGLAGTLGDLRAQDWNGKRERFGHLLESFVLQELLAQAGWTDPDLRFHHYRDKDQVEVDCVITRGTKVWGVEVKAATTVDSSDSKGLRRLAARAGADFQGGIVFYNGDSTLALGDSGFLAVPLAKLWEM